MDNTLLAAANVSGAPQIWHVYMVTRRGSGLVIGCPVGRDIVPQRGADFGENISKARRRCTTFFVEPRSFFSAAGDVKSD